MQASKKQVTQVFKKWQKNIQENPQDFDFDAYNKEDCAEAAALYFCQLMKEVQAKKKKNENKKRLRK